MKLDSFRLIGKYIWNNKEFLLFSNDNCFRFPIRVLDNGSLIYPTLEEFEFFYKTFCFSNKEFYIFNKGKSQRDFETGKNVRFTPKVINNGRLIPVATALVILGLTGYTIKTFSEPYDPSPVSPIEYQVETTTVDNSSEEISDAEFCRRLGFKVEELPCGLLKLNGDKDDTIAGTINEIDDRLGPPVSYEDVINTISQNEKINDDCKEIFISGLENLEKNGLNLDLRILNYNMRRLNILELPRSEIQKRTGVDNILALFNPKDGNMYLSNDNDPIVKEKRIGAIRHEGIGHGETTAILDDGKTTIISKMFVANVVGKGDARVVSSNMIGMSTSEAIAEMITAYAQDGNYEISYDAELFQLDFIKDLLNLDDVYIIENGTTGVINAMSEFGFEKPQNYIVNMDAETAALQSNIDEYQGITVAKNVSELVAEYTDIRLSKGDSIEEIKNSIKNAFENSRFDGEVVVNSIKRMDVCNIEELKEEILSSLDNRQQGNSTPIVNEDMEH